MKPTIIIGAGPAGLTAAYALSKAGRAVVVLESDAEYVGGLSRTVLHRGFRFDIGGHRFFSRSAEIEALWSEILGDEMLTRPRLSRIYFRGQLFAYPIQILDTFRKLGPLEAVRCVLSFMRARLAPARNPASVEEWVTNQFGRRLYEMFFKTYTEKVWGISCRDISADWAAQRIKGVSLTSTVKEALARPFRRAGSAQVPKSLIESFRYPRLGPGMMWEVCRDKIRAHGGEVLMGHRVVQLHRDPSGSWRVEAETPDGTRHEFIAAHVISSAPIAEMVPAISPTLPEAARQAARSLRYRDFLTVALMVRDKGQVADNWIYIHDPGVRVGRIQNYKAWSPDLVPDAQQACFGLEYFCFEGDGLWQSSDADLIALATREIAAIGLVQPGDVLDGCVVRQRQAYPVYDNEYTSHVAAVRHALAAYPGLHLVGRNGMHKYNNQDHSMMTALLTVRNIIEGRTAYDVWRVNQDAEYHESAGGTSGERIVPRTA